MPRPAMLVAIVTAPLRPACATIDASRSWYLAFRTTCGIPLRLSIPESISLFSIDRVPTRVGWPALVAVLDLLDRGVPLLARAAEDEVGPVGPDHVAVGRDDDDVELVDVLELRRLGHRRAGHAGELLVHAEEVLEGDRGERLVLALDLDALLGLDRLVQAVRPAAAGHHAAGELVDDDHLAVLDQVLDVAPVEVVRAQPLVDAMDQIHVLDVVEVVDVRGASRPCPTPWSVRATVCAFSSTRKSPVVLLLPSLSSISSPRSSLGMILSIW